MPEHAVQHDQNAQPGRAHEPERCYDAGPRVYPIGADRMLQISDFLPVFTICPHVYGYATDGGRNYGGPCLSLDLPGSKE